MRQVRTRKRFDIVDYLPAIMAVIGVAVITVLLVIIFHTDIKTVKRSSLKNMPFSAQSTYVPFAGGAVFIDNNENRLYYVDDRSEIMWGFAGTTEDMKLYASVSRAAVTTGKKLQVVNKDGTLVFSKEFDKAISDITLGEKLTAVALSHSDDTIILNAAGEEIDRITSNSNCTNIRFGVYTSDSVWVITAQTSGYSPVFQLSTYKYENEKTQTVTFDTDNQMMYDAVFCDNLCYIFGTEKIMVRDCNYTGAVNNDYSANGYDVVASGLISGKMHILLMNNGNLKAIGEKAVKDVPCEEKINCAAVSQKGYFGFSNYFMYKFNPKNGSYKKYRFPVKVDGLVQGDGYVFITSGSTIYRFDISA